MATILVIDDERALRESIARYLRRLGHEVLEAPDGRTGLGTIAASAVDLVITDLRMPEMDGIELIQALRRAGFRAPVIAMSGGGLYPHEVLLDNAKLLGAMSTLGKPFELDQLRQSVEQALGGEPKA
ncbi:MAG: response regulator [Longimicrobiales bacterium]